MYWTMNIIAIIIFLCSYVSAKFTASVRQLLKEE